MANKRQRSITYPGLNNVYKFAEEAVDFDASVANSAGDYVIYDGDLYRITADRAAGTSWANTTKTKTNTTDEIKRVEAKEDEAVGDLKSALENTSDGDLGNKWLIFKKGKYSAQTTSITGEVISYADSDEIICAICPCTEGDAFTAKLIGPSGVSRAYVFCDSNMNGLSAYASASYNMDETVYAPANAAYVVFNNKLASMPSGYYAYKGNSTNRTINAFVDSVENAVSVKVISDPLEFVQGSINASTGGNSTTNKDKRLRCNDYYYVPLGFEISIPSGFRVYLYYYSEAAYTSFIRTGGRWLTGTVSVKIPEGLYVRFSISKDDDTNLTPSDLTSDIVVTRSTSTDKTLSLENKAADAKTTGDRLNNTLGYKLGRQLNSNDDLDDFKENSIARWTTSSSPAHSPTVYHAVVAAFKPGSYNTANDCFQMVANSNGSFWTRIYNASSDEWLNWNKIKVDKESSTSYNLSSYTINGGNIRADGTFNSLSISTAAHILIPIGDVEIVTIQANEANPALFAFLKNNDLVDGAIAPFANGEMGRRQIPVALASSYRVPSDAQYLYVYLGKSSTNYAYTPASISGYNLLFSFDTFEAALDSVISKRDGVLCSKIRDIPKNQGVRNAYKKMHQLLDVEYTTPVEIASRSDMPAGDYQGVIYSGTADKAHYVGWNVSLRSFMTAIHNQYSGIYTEDTEEDASVSAYDGVVYHGKNSNTPLGIVCAPFVAFVLGMDVKWENQYWPYLERIGVLEKIEDQSYTGVELCDTLYQSGHVAIVSDIYRDSRGVPIEIYVSESWSPRGRSTVYSPSSFTEYLNNNEVIIYRYKDLYKNLDYTPSEFVAVDGEKEVPAYAYNDDICPYLGDYSIYRQGELIAMCYTKGNYTQMVIAKNGSIVHTITLPESSSNHIIDLRSYNLTEGSYTAKLSNGGILESAPAYFKVVDMPISVSENGDNITVQFAPSKNPQYIQICTPSGAAFCVVELSDAEKVSGIKTFNVQEIYDDQQSTASGASAYAIVMYKVVDPAGYNLLRSSEFVSLTWNPNA